MLFRSNKDLVHPLGITRKIKFQWNDYNIQLYEDGAMRLNKVDVSHFYTRAINKVFVTIIPNADVKLRHARQFYGLE